MKLHIIQNIRAILTSRQVSVTGDQIGVVVEAVAALHEEEQKILDAEKAATAAETEKRVAELVDKRIKDAIAETEKELAPPAGV